MVQSSYITSDLFNSLDLIHLRFSKELRGFFAGSNISRVYGSSLDFADYKEYAFGDDIRLIDWNLYTRLQKHYIKLFHDERQMNVEIYFDTSASMNKPVIKAEYASAVAVILSYLALKSNNRVSIFPLIGDEVDQRFKNISTKEIFFKKIDDFLTLKYKDEVDISKAIISNHNFNKEAKGLTVIISDFLMDNDYEKAVKYLQFQKRQVLLLQILSKEETEPNYLGRINFLDSEMVFGDTTKELKLNITKEHHDAYERALHSIKDRVKAIANRHGGDYAFLAVQENICKSLFKELFKVRLI